jgi:WD40 repeat protein
MQTFSGHASEIPAVSLSGDAKYAISGSADKALILWDLEPFLALPVTPETAQIAPEVSP